MRCLKPISIRNPTWFDDSSAEKWLVVPCGKCPLCLARRRSEWAFRLTEHAKTCTNNFFITLTYDNEFLPLDRNGVAHVSKRDCQNFMKRLRKRLSIYDNSSSLSYYLTSEYGPETLRPHYHLLLFDVPKEIDSESKLYKLVMLSWQMGFVQVGYLVDGGNAYACKYILHPLEFNNKILTKPFSLMSKGITKKYLTKQKVDYFRSHNKYSFKINDKITTLPRYLRSKIFSPEELKVISDELISELKYIKTQEQKLDIIDCWKNPNRIVPLSEQKLVTQANRIVKNLKTKHKLSKL